MNQKHIEKMVRKCMTHLKKKGYELEITKADVDNAVRITRAVNSGSGYGGRDTIQIPLQYWQTEKVGYQEYKSFNKCPVIGGREDANAEQTYWLITAHEVSHHVQYLKGDSVPWLKRIYSKPHGEGFRTIYSLLRSGLINPMLDGEKT